MSIIIRTQTNKAFLTILEGTHKGLVIFLPLQFNPSEYTVGRTNNYSKKDLKNTNDAKFQFLSSQNDDLTLEMLFDSTDEGTDVRLKLLPMETLALMDFEAHAPSPCMFVWGSFQYIGIIGKLTKKFTYFYQNGTPARVRVKLVLKSYIDPKTLLAKLRKHSVDLTKQRISKSGDNIWLMAFREYEDSRNWRDIAKFNDIDDPRTIAAGTKLTLPPRKKDA